MRTDGQTDMMKLTVTFRNFANARKKGDQDLTLHVGKHLVHCYLLKSHLRQHSEDARHWRPLANCDCDLLLRKRRRICRVEGQVAKRIAEPVVRIKWEVVALLQRIHCFRNSARGGSIATSQEKSIIPIGLWMWQQNSLSLGHRLYHWCREPHGLIHAVRNRRMAAWSISALHEQWKLEMYKQF
jgi:hypothetical protein